VKFCIESFGAVDEEIDDDDCVIDNVDWRHYDSQTHVLKLLVLQVTASTHTNQSIIV